MALAATSVTKEPRNFSIGPWKMRILNVTALDNDTSGTITVDGMSEVIACLVAGGLTLTAAPTFSANVITLAFADPGTGNAFGTALVIGR